MAKRKSSKEMLDKAEAIKTDLIVKAMEKYAEQEAIGFHQWLNVQKNENKIGNKGLMKLWNDYLGER